jgi:hypothetical protein
VDLKAEEVKLPPLFGSSCVTFLCVFFTLSPLNKELPTSLIAKKTLVTWTEFALTPWSRMITEPLVVAQLITNFPDFLESERSLPLLKKSPFDSILCHINPVKNFVHYICSTYIKNIISSLCKSSSCSLTFSFTNQCFLWSYIISDTFYMTHHAIALDLVPWMLSGKGHKLWNSSLRILPQILVTSCHLLAHIPSSALVPNTNIFIQLLFQQNAHVFYY